VTEQTSGDLRLTGVTKTYDTPAGPFFALRNAGLEIATGELAAIVGKSGSGKSTLLNLIGGMDSPTSGSLVIDGIAVHALPPGRLTAWRGRNVGFVFQFFQLLPTLTAVENVMMPMDFIGVVPARARRQRALALLDRVGVADQAIKLPSTLSGGQQQRVAIARALANDPRIVLADEPTGNLDSATATSILDLFRAMANDGATVVIATHDRDIGRVADRIAEITDGVTTANAFAGQRREQAG